jgi:shikimate dehydrogenase
VTRRAAVLGHPVAHSLSPVLHRAAHDALGLDWDYTAVDVDEAGLAAFVEALGPEWAGLSLTMPLKRAVLPLLDEADAVVGVVGAANTLVLRDGRRYGANTDVPGMVAALRESGGHFDQEAGLLGGGATAASTLAALSELGVRAVQAFVRRPEAGAGLLDVADRVGVDLTVSRWADAAQGMVTGLVVSTVPAGAADELVHMVPTLPGTLLDVVYEPWPTALAAQWTVRGGTVVSGLDLLVHQAALQVRLMTGREVGVDVLRAALPET